MSNLALLDTGFTDVLRTNGNFATFSAATAEEVRKGQYKANDGGTIEVPSNRITFTIGSNLDSTANPNNNLGSEIGVGSSQNGRIVLRGFFDTSDQAQMDNILHLKRMTQTKGVKLLFYTSVTDSYSDIELISILGDDVNLDKVPINNDNHVNGVDLAAANHPHLHVFVTSIQFDQPAKNDALRGYSITVEVTN